MLRVVNLYGYHVILIAVFEPGSHIVPEGTVAVWPLAKVVAVDPYFTVAVNTVKGDVGKLLFVIAAYPECLAVPSDAAGQGPAAGRGRMLLAELPLDTPVMRQLKLTPSAVIITRLKGFITRCKRELPPVIETDMITRYRL